MTDAPLADVLYIKEHPTEFPGVASEQTTQRTYPQVQLPEAQGTYPAAQVLGYVGTINSAELTSRASQGTRPATPSARPASSTSTRRSCTAPPGSRSSRSTPRARWRVS